MIKYPGGANSPPSYDNSMDGLVKTKSTIPESLQPVLWGIVGGGILLAVYFGILTFSNSFTHAIEELRNIWMWILPLTLGFGIQAGLFSYIKITSRRKASLTSTASVAAAGGVSTTAMVACCMHHVTDVLPILGASAASIFLIQYQSVFLAVGVISNLLGINIMLRVIQKGELYDQGRGLLGMVLKVNMDRALIVNGLAGAVFIAVVLIRTLQNNL
ncbi:MAG: hypothetical protein ACC640_01430 [bacterium]